MKDEKNFDLFENSDSEESISRKSDENMIKESNLNLNKMTQRPQPPKPDSTNIKRDEK